MQVEEVFRVSGYPEHTYVPRPSRLEADNGDGPKAYLEDELSAILRTPGRCAIIIGPSKSGKNSLVHNVLPEEQIIYVNCADITSAEDVWATVANEAGIPIRTTKRADQGTADTIGGEVSGGLSKLIASISGRLWGSRQKHAVDSETSEFGGPSRGKLLKGLRTRKQVLVIDEFHYLPRMHQVELGRQVKSAGERKISTILLLVGYRGLEPLDLVPDLRGRADVVELEYWDTPELMKIGEVGFPELGVTIESSVIRRLAEESLGSPQLMQNLCMELCILLRIRERVDKDPVPTVTQEMLNDVCERVARSAHAASLFKRLSAGREPEMQEQMPRRDGQRTNIESIILDAVAHDPPKRKLGRVELETRIAKVLPDGVSAHGLRLALRWMSDAADAASREGSAPTDPVLYWDNSELHFPDPYFLFYLRWAA